MHARLLCLLGFLSLFVLGGFASAQTRPATTRYVDKENRFSFEHPENWEKGPAAGDTLVLFRESLQPDAKFQTNINVVMKSVPATEPKPRISDVAEQIKAGLKQQFPTAKFLEEGPETIGGLDAYRLTYTMQFNGVELHFTQVFVVKGDKAYIITFSTLPKDFAGHRATLDAMLKSFKFGE